MAGINLNSCFKKMFAIVALIFVVANSASALDQKAASSISISDAYVYVPLGTSQITKAFFTVKNNTDEDVTLVKVTSAQVKNIELFPQSTSAHKKDVAKKTHSSSLAAEPADDLQHNPWTISAGQSIKLRPEDQYLQLTGLKTSLTTGDELQLEVSTSSGKKIPVVAHAKSAFDQVHGH